jgi:ribosomal protein S18 acetylase RimI-like enzyme
MANLITKLFGGPFRSVLEQAEAQPQKPLPLPAQITVADHELTLRYLDAGDLQAILAFVGSLPDHDLLFLRRDITRRDQVEHWLHEAAIGQLVTIFALDGEAIVGYATVASDGLAWTRHVRELRVMVAPQMRGQNLGQLLTAAAFAVAKEHGAKKMIAQMTVDQQGAIRVFRKLGFEPEARLKGQVIDREGHLHDLQIMSLDVDAFASRLEAALWSSLAFDTPR